jgi:hypothetical protein
VFSNCRCRTCFQECTFTPFSLVQLASRSREVHETSGLVQPNSTTNSTCVIGRMVNLVKRGALYTSFHLSSDSSNIHHDSSQQVPFISSHYFGTGLMPLFHPVVNFIVQPILATITSFLLVFSVWNNPNSKWILPAVFLCIIQWAVMIKNFLAERRFQETTVFHLFHLIPLQNFSRHGSFV